MPKICHITIRDEVWCVVGGLMPNDVEFLYKKFGVFVDGYFFMPKYKMGVWDGKIRFFEKTGKTYVRLLHDIVPILIDRGYDLELTDKRVPVVAPTERCAADRFQHVEMGGRPFIIRPYQVDCVNAAIESGSGFIIAGTGAGKTTITGALSDIYSKAGYKTITIVPSSDLVDQTFEWYEALGMDVGRYDGTNKNIDHMNVIATWQALQYNPSVLRDFQALIWDEAHGCRASVAQKLLNESGSHIAFRFGVTGTLPKPEAEQMSLAAAIGPVLKSISAKWLMENDYLSQVEIEPVEINELYVDEDFPDYASEKSFLSKSTHRMETIADIIISKCAANGNTLVLVNSIPFGEKLAGLIKGAVFLYGESPKDLRKEHYQMFEEHDDLIVVASSGIASTGISIDRVFCLILVDAGKSFIKSIQSIGRGLRKGRDKDAVHVVDIYSKQKWAKKHWKEREKHYKEAQYPISKKQTVKVKGD